MNRRNFLQMLALLSLGGAARGSAAIPVGKAGTRPPVIMVVLDTVRASHCGAWGYVRQTTPHLGRLCAVATRYSRAVAPAPWTLPSHASFFTGRYPFEHGARTRLMTTEAGVLTVFEPPLDEAEFTLAEGLRMLGYQCGAFVANSVFLSERYNLMQGFEPVVIERLPGLPMADQGLAWMNRVHGDPFFAFFNFMDAHRPYNLSNGAVSPNWNVPNDPGLLDELCAAAMPGTGEVSPRLVDQVVCQYDLGILNADHALGLVLSWLESAGLFEESLIVVVSDHGEFLGEHHLVEHSKDVFQGTAWVPMAVKLPGQNAPRVVDDWTSLCMIPGLVLGHIGASDLERAGAMLVGALPTRPVLCENSFSRAWDFGHEIWGHRFRRQRTAYYEGCHKLIYSTDAHHGVFDLDSDPGECRNLAESQPALLARLIDALRRFKRVDDTDEAVPLREELPPLYTEEIEEMEAIGYLTNGAAQD
jgi:arylsulfatase A-like enzyme